MTGLKIPIVLMTAVAVSLAQQPSPSSGLLVRRYRPGEQMKYLMKGCNNDRTYQIHMTAAVRKPADGPAFEEYVWSDLVADGAPQALTSASREFRQAITLAGDAPFRFPDLSRVQPALIGPVTDLLTFYADLFLATRSGQLHKPGDRFFFPSPGASSWADGTRVLTGESAVDFDIRLVSMDQARRVATLLIKHVPPSVTKIKIPAEWMQNRAAAAPPNWIQISRTANTYIASTGRETFDVELKIDLSNGRILSATMDNLVEAVARECTDSALSECGEPRADRTVRRIEMSLVSSAP